MKIRSLEELELISVTDNMSMYDLTPITFRPVGTSYAFFEYIVPKHFEMRIDLISNDIYSTTEYSDFLLWLNRIINPFNISEGRSIKYVDPNSIPDFYAPKQNREEVQQVFLNKAKARRRDSKREKFIEEKRSLPPTVNESKNEQVKLNGNTVIIGGDIFNV